MARRGAHETVARPHWWRRAALGLLFIAAASGIVLLTLNVQRGPSSVAATSSSSPAPTPPPSPATVTVTRPMSPDELRAAFLSLAAHDRGYDSILPVDALPSLAQQVCTTVAAGGDADAVWAAAGDLEKQHGLPPAPAWDFIGLAVTTYCPEHHMLVLSTTAAMGD